MTQWLTAKEAAEHVRLSERSFRMAVIAGRYPQGRAAAMGRRKLWLASELDAALRGEKDDAASATADPIMAAIHARYPQTAEARRGHKG